MPRCKYCGEEFAWGGSAIIKLDPETGENHVCPEPYRVVAADISEFGHVDWKARRERIRRYFESREDSLPDEDS